MKQSPFRSIRMALFKEGKLLRYLGYAVGEIALIIIGIMLALQLNNWNEDRKAQAELELYVLQLKEDVRLAISVAEYRSEVAEKRMQSALTVLRGIKDSIIELEDLKEFETALNVVDVYSFAGIHLQAFILGSWANS
jgi:microsomal dipeptidase-like Zn-dependent dipeptidase